MEILIEIVLGILLATLIHLANSFDRRMGRPPLRLPPWIAWILEIF